MGFFGSWTSPNSIAFGSRHEHRVGNASTRIGRISSRTLTTTRPCPGEGGDQRPDLQRARSLQVRGEHVRDLVPAARVPARRGHILGNRAEAAIDYVLCDRYLLDAIKYTKCSLRKTLAFRQIIMLFSRLSICAANEFFIIAARFENRLDGCRTTPTCPATSRRPTSTAASSCRSSRSRRDYARSPRGRVQRGGASPDSPPAQVRRKQDCEQFSCLELPRRRSGAPRATSYGNAGMRSRWKRQWP